MIQHIVSDHEFFQSIFLVGFFSGMIFASTLVLLVNAFWSDKK